MFSVFFTDRPVRNFEDAKAADHERYARFFHHMLDRGVYLPPSGYELWSLSHRARRRDDRAHARGRGVVRGLAPQRGDRAQATAGRSVSSRTSTPSMCIATQYVPDVFPSPSVTGPTRQRTLTRSPFSVNVAASPPSARMCASRTASVRPLEPEHLQQVAPSTRVGGPADHSMPRRRSRSAAAARRPWSRRTPGSSTVGSDDDVAATGRGTGWVDDRYLVGDADQLPLPHAPPPSGRCPVRLWAARMAPRIGGRPIPGALGGTFDEGGRGTRSAYIG